MLETRTVQDPAQWDEAICPSLQMRKVDDFVTRVAQTDLDVLITGEPGVGKERLALRLHRLSKHSGKPLTRIDPEQLEASLFAGGLLGTRPFVAWSLWSSRDGSTLYFDEISDLSESIQAALLQMILDRESRCSALVGAAKPETRILAATCRDLWTEVSRGRFREDLFLRLQAVKISIPPLRERPEDIPVLVASFLDELAGELLRPLKVEFQPAQLEALASCRWPGNVRELRDFVRRVVLDGTDLSKAIEDRQRSLGKSEEMTEQSRLSLSEAALLTSKAVERRLILKALEATGGDTRQASRRLNISYRTLLGKIRSLEIAVN